MKEVRTYFCKVCSKSLFGSAFKFEGVCSVDCFNHLKFGLPLSEKKCLVCGKGLKSYQRKFCSKKCMYEHPEFKPKRNCSSLSRMNSCGKYKK